jgi:hypothetical protein
MDFSKLSANEKLAVYGAVAAILGGLVGSVSGLIWLAVLAAIGVLAVIFLPQLAPKTTLPGSKGSLLVALGGVAAVAAALSFLVWLPDIGLWFEINAIRSIAFVIGVAGSLLIGWIGWQEFQAEGGKFQLGTGAAAAPPPPSADEAAAAPPPAAPSEPPSASTAPPPTAPAEPAPPAEAERRDETRGA